MFRKEFDSARERVRKWVGENQPTNDAEESLLSILDDLEQVVEDTHAEDSEGADW